MHKNPIRDDRKKNTKTEADKAGSEEEEDEEDFMSDAFLSLAQSSSKNKDAIETYTEKRRKEINQGNERGKILNRSEREIEARKAGLRRHLFGELEDGKDSEARGMSKRKREDVEISSNKAFQMMMAMGYQPGKGLGKQDDGDDEDEDEDEVEDAVEKRHVKNKESHNKAAILEPIQLDERWLGLKARSGIGRLSAQSAQALSRDICKATEREHHKNNSLSAEESFRLRSREDHSIRHWEKLLVDARKTCEDLDTALGVKFSPLWMNPESLTKQADQLPEHVAQLLEYAFLGLEEKGKQEEEAVARAEESKRFCLLSTKARLEITLSHLRRAHNYCIFCGHRYDTFEELSDTCPGEEEDDH